MFSFHFSYDGETKRLMGGVSVNGKEFTFEEPFTDELDDDEVIDFDELEELEDDEDDYDEFEDDDGYEECEDDDEYCDDEELLEDLNIIINAICALKHHIENK